MRTYTCIIGQQEIKIKIKIINPKGQWIRPFSCRAYAMRLDPPKGNWDQNNTLSSWQTNCVERAHDVCTSSHDLGHCHVIIRMPIFYKENLEELKKGERVMSFFIA